MSSYPAEKGFTTALTQQDLSPVTIKSYGQTIQRLLTFLAANRPQALIKNLDSVTTTDLRAYLSYLKDERQVTVNSYNKTLAQLNRYFTYLFENHLITTYPTLPLHGQANPTKKREDNAEWLSKLPRILADDEIHFYTRLTLLLCAHGFTVGEFLQPGFVKTWQKIKPTFAGEQHFREAFAQFHQSLADRQQCDDLFLKQRMAIQSPRLTNSGLHKYLHSDEQALGMNLSPSKLHQDYVLSALENNPGQSNQVLMQKLHLDPASLLYYQHLLVKLNSSSTSKN